MYQCTNTFSTENGKIFYEEKIYLEDEISVLSDTTLENVKNLEWIIDLGEIENEQHSVSEWPSTSESINGSSDANLE